MWTVATVLVTCARKSTVCSAVTVPFALILTGTSRDSTRAVTTVTAPLVLRAACASCFFDASDHHHALPAARTATIMAIHGHLRRFPDAGTVFIDTELSPKKPAGAWGSMQHFA